jgi:mRNA interferase RelE/StbE
VKVQFKDSFAKDLKGVKDKGLLKRLREVVEFVESAASLNEIHNLKKLKGGGDYFRLRVGDYRVGIALENDAVIFVRFLNRKDIYKYFP